MTWRRYIFGFIGVVLGVWFQEADLCGTPVTVSVAETSKICDTPDCVLSAAEMIKNMNTSADPCQDFNEFACGRFIKETVIPDGRSGVSAFTVLADQNKVILRDIITREMKPAQPRYLRNIQRFYRSCVDEAHIEAVGLAPYLNDRAFVDDWPTLNPSWSGANFDLSKVIARYASVFVEPIFTITVTNDMADSNKHVIYIRDGTLELGREYYRRPRNDSVLQAYEKYLVETAVALNADREVAEQDAKEVVDLEIELTQVMVSREESRDFKKQMNPSKLNELSRLFPELDISGVLRAVFNTVNITLADDERIINRFPSYIGNISTVTQRFSNRTVQNLFGFRYALFRVVSLTRSTREILLNFERVYTGATTESPRWQVCVGSTASTFWKGISKQFVSRKFSEKAKLYVSMLIDNLTQEFKKMIQEAAWMCHSTKKEAFRKLAAMKRKIGYPDVEFEEADIEKFYENHTMRADDYYNNRALGNTITRLEVLGLLRKPVDKRRWSVSPHDVNAYYNWFPNDIVFLAGILQAPFFSESFPDYMNYGAIGSAIGHEITHGFDDQGSQYDSNGHFRNWWATNDRQNFVQRSKCIVDQNSEFQLNGINTQGESVADNGGIKESFRAYREHVRRSGQQLRLPGLQLSQEQTFFIAFAQMYCEKVTPERFISLVTTGVHPPGKYRIIGTLQNSEDFAKVYNCPQGSYMNPEKKCSVW